MKVFLTGGTGYMGSRLIPLLMQRGHEVKALVRKGSEPKLPGGPTLVLGDPLRMDSYTDQVRGADTFVHLIGVAHPSPAKAKEFREIDLPSMQVAVKAAREAGIGHFVYLSVAQPAKMMQAFIAVRSEGERIIRESGTGDIRPALVCAWTRASLALCASALLLDLRTAARDKGIGA